MYSRVASGSGSSRKLVSAAAPSSSLDSASSARNQRDEREGERTVIVALSDTATVRHRPLIILVCSVSTFLNSPTHRQRPGRHDQAQCTRRRQQPHARARRPRRHAALPWQRLDSCAQRGRCRSQDQAESDLTRRGDPEGVSQPKCRARPQDARRPCHLEAGSEALRSSERHRRRRGTVGRRTSEAAICRAR